MIRPGQEKRVVGLIGLGGCLFFGGLIIGAMGFMAGAAAASRGNEVGPIMIGRMGLGVAFIGVVVMGYSVFRGLATAHGWFASKEIVTYSGVRAMSRFVQDPEGQLHFLTEPLEDLNWPHYVQLHHPDGRQMELRVDPEVFWSIDEGCAGTAIVQGLWLRGWTRDAGGR